jgi:hypothetical protein
VNHQEVNLGLNLLQRYLNPLGTGCCCGAKAPNICCKPKSHVSNTSAASAEEKQACCDTPRIMSVYMYQPSAQSTFPRPMAMHLLETTLHMNTCSHTSPPKHSPCPLWLNSAAGCRRRPAVATGQHSRSSCCKTLKHAWCLKHICPVDMPTKRTHNR